MDDNYLIDPNPKGKGNIPLEDLSIEADLHVYGRNRSFISVDENINKRKIAVIKGKEVPFNKGTKYGNKFSLSTDYTNLGDEQNEGYETLGITNIDIDYNSSYMPIININLVDVRGKLFQKGNESPYSEFFNFPYPLFELKVKGYYGKPVEYLLHLTTFNTKMDSDNGNFNIKCSFVGYTYAYLTDMLLGYLKAIPYTTIGDQLIQEKLNRGETFVTFDELYEYSKILNNKVINIRNNDERLESLALGEKKINDFKDIKIRIKSQLDAMNVDGFNEINTDGYFLILKKGSSVEKINTLFKNIREEVIIYNNDIGSENNQYKIPHSIFDLNESRYLKNLDKKDFINEEGVELEKYYGTNNVLLNLDDGDKFNIIKLKLKKTSFVGSVDVIFLKDILELINEKIILLEKIIKKKYDEVSEQFLAEAGDLKVVDLNGNIKEFDFNIYNYTKVLCDHVDLLMESIEKVSLKAEDNDRRNKILKMEVDCLTDIVDPNKFNKIYAFPEYTEKNGTDDVFKETWIGSRYPEINEVHFIKELYNGLIKSKISENEYLSQLVDINTQWYSINPFDTLLFTNGDNIWDSVSNTTGRDGEIIRLMAMRASIFMGFSVRNPTKKEIVKTAQLEANTLFNKIKNDKTKDVLLNINENSFDVEAISTTIRDIISDTSGQIINEFNEINQGSIFKKIETDVSGNFIWTLFGDKFDELKKFERYHYIAGHETITKADELILGEDDGELELVDGTRFFLPLHFKNNENRFDGRDFIDKENNLATPNDRITLREKGNIFFSDYMGNHVKGNNKPDDGATYIDIISDLEYKNIETKGNTYGGDIVKGLTTDKEIYSESDLTGNFENVLFNGKLNNNEFMLYSDGNETLDFYKYFYDNESRYTFKSITTGENYNGNIFSFLNGESNFKLLNLKMNSILKEQQFDIFGTNFYYQQDNIFARAFLFLYSIPFRGIVNGEGTNKDKLKKEIFNLFDKKSSFMQVPYSWLLFMGGLIYYNENGDMLKFLNGDTVLVPYNKYGNGTTNYKPFFNFDGSYLYTVLDSLPDSVKNKLSKLFVDWVGDSNGFPKIKSELEFFDESYSDEDRYRIWVEFFEPENKESAVTYDTPNYSVSLKFNERVISKGELYRKNDLDSKISYIKKGELDGGSLINFNLELKKDSSGYTTLKNFLNDSRVLVNGTWRIWANDLDSPANDARIPGSSFPITFKSEDMDDYLGNFIKEFKKLRNNENNENKKIKGEIFGGVNIDEIYLTIYKNIKSIKDKWVGGPSKNFTNLIETFNFLDRGHNDIGEEFKLNPMSVTNLLTSNYNTSFYSHISRVLNNNNFDFIAMPNFIDYNNMDEVKNLFKTYSYNEDVATVRPSFICLYIGENSKSLDMNNSFRDDGYNIPDNVPNDLTKVPSILVRYGDDNQSIFKDLELDQAEYSETNESLMVTDQIANSYNSINSIGQNIFNVYSNRSYNSTVTLLGNAMLQPFMYYQLDNIPMFRGAYIVKKVTHNIKPNHMTTTMVGNRVRRIKTKLIDKSTIFTSIIGGLNKIKIDGGSNLDYILSDKPLINSNMNPKLYEKYFNYYKDNKPYDDGDFERNSNTIIIENGVERYMTYNEIFKKVSDITGVSVINIKTISVVESTVGRGNANNNGINSSGYVGLMQFGRPAVLDVQPKVESVLFHKNEYENYQFYGKINVSDKTLLIPPIRTDGINRNWDSDYSINNENNNSFYDDFISTLGYAFYGLRYVPTNKINNITDTYIAHQQGPKGYNTITQHPHIKINGLAKNNLPKGSKGEKLKNGIIFNQDFYLAWSGKLESIATSIDPNHVVIVGS